MQNMHLTSASNPLARYGLQPRVSLPPSPRLGQAQQYTAPVTSSHTEFNVSQQHGSLLRISPVAKSVFIPAAAGLTCGLAGTAVANQTGLGEPLALAVGLVLTVGTVFLDRVSIIREEQALERERTIFLNRNTQGSILVATSAICDACSDDLSQVEIFLKRQLGIDSEAPLTVMITTRDGVSRTLDLQLQVKSGGTISAFLRGIIAVTAMV